MSFGVRAEALARVSFPRPPVRDALEPRLAQLDRRLETRAPVDHPTVNDDEHREDDARRRQPPSLHTSAYGQDRDDDGDDEGQQPRRRDRGIPASESRRGPAGHGDAAFIDVRRRLASSPRWSSFIVSTIPSLWSPRHDRDRVEALGLRRVRLDARRRSHAKRSTLGGGWQSAGVLGGTSVTIPTNFELVLALSGATANDFPGFLVRRLTALFLTSGTEGNCVVRASPAGDLRARSRRLAAEPRRVRTRTDQFSSQSSFSDGDSVRGASMGPHFRKQSRRVVFVMGPARLRVGLYFSSRRGSHPRRSSSGITGETG